MKLNTFNLIAAVGAAGLVSAAPILVDQGLGASSKAPGSIERHLDQSSVHSINYAVKNVKSGIVARSIANNFFDLPAFFKSSRAPSPLEFSRWLKSGDGRLLIAKQDTMPARKDVDIDAIVADLPTKRKPSAAGTERTLRELLEQTRA